MNLLTDAVKHAESPRWSDGRLWFSDVHDYAVKSIGLAGDLRRVANAPGRPSGLGRLPDGRWLVVTSLDGKLNYLDGDSLRQVCDLEPLILGLAGDMVVDGLGRAYISDTGYDHGAGEEPRPGRVLLWTEDGGPRIVAEDINWANGGAVSPDGTRFYLAETFGECILVFDIDPDGSLSGRRVFAELRTLTDGICLDDDGGVWVGLPTTNEFAYVDRQGGVTRRVRTRGAMATACALGGEERRTLFTCSVNSTPETLSSGATAGGVIEWVPVDVGGAGWP